MNSDGRSTSQQLYIPILLVVGGCPTLVGRCTTAADSAGLGVKTCSLGEAPAAIPLRHPLAIVVPNRVFDSASDELLALARDVRSVLFPVDSEVTVRELEAMFAAAIAACSSQRERRSAAGRYSLTDGFAEEAPFSRRSEGRTSWSPSPPSSRRASATGFPAGGSDPKSRQVLPRVTPQGQSVAPGLAATRPRPPLGDDAPTTTPPRSKRPVWLTADDLPTYRPPPLEGEDPDKAPDTLRPGERPGLRKPEIPRPPATPRAFSERPAASATPSLTPPLTDPPCSGTQPVERPSYAALRAVFSAR